MNFGKSLREAQAIRGVRSVQLAERFGVFPQQVNRWRNLKNGNAQLITKVCKELKYDELEFIALGMT